MRKQFVIGNRQSAVEECPRCAKNKERREEIMITKKQLQDKVNFLKQSGFDIEISYAYGRPRIENGSGSRDISPRLPRGEMALWLSGFMAALDEQERQATKLARMERA